MTHKERVLDNVKSLSNITDSVVSKVDSNIYSIAARKMSDILGETSYDVYVLLQVEPTVVAEIEDEDWAYETSSYDGRKLKNLEFAEAYCILHYLAITLKKIDIDTFMTEVESWGEGSINPIDITKILSYGDRYLLEAKTLVKIYSGDTGTVGVFAV